MSDINQQNEPEEEEVTPDYTKFDEDSVPPPEKVGWDFLLSFKFYCSSYD